MSLNFYFDEIEGGTDVTHEWQAWEVSTHGDFEEWPEDRRRGEDDEREVFAMAALTHALIFNSMSIGIGCITADNAAEVYARTKIIEAIHGDLVVYGDKNKKFKLEPEHIQKHIGLKTNVSYETREEWAQRMFIGDGDELDQRGEKLVPMDEDERIDFSKPTDVSHPTSFARDYRRITRRRAEGVAQAAEGIRGG